MPLPQVGIKIEDLDRLSARIITSTISALRPRSSGAARHHAVASNSKLERLTRMLSSGPPAARPEAREFFLTHGFPIDKYPLEGMRPAWMGTDMYNPLPQPDKFIERRRHRSRSAIARSK